MQADEDVGKIALAVPVLVCKFCKNLRVSCICFKISMFGPYLLLLLKILRHHCFLLCAL